MASTLQKNIHLKKLFIKNFRTKKYLPDGILELYVNHAQHSFKNHNYPIFL